ncbi:hypothetical protein T03_3594 [Trichinella britovi]|uniref:Uncharacterized protein n=1 Tax=Trichinella britovi TaxID=45882 RepID=A0A0V1D035_TRIBR|nr:hypothetical protein T03_3594 [Trichinella britovi]
MSFTYFTFAANLIWQLCTNVLKTTADTGDKFAKSSVFTSILPLLENMRCCYCIVSSRFCLGGMIFCLMVNGMCFKISALKCH